MARNPLVAAADPIPISGKPYIARRRRGADNFLARRRWSYQDDSAHVMTLIGNHDAATKRSAQHQAAQQSGANPFLTHDPTRVRATST
jgi:hypothetical protein